MVQLVLGEIERHNGTILHSKVRGAVHQLTTRGNLNLRKSINERE
jgi:hypothetical protein